MVWLLSFQVRRIMLFLPKVLQNVSQVVCDSHSSKERQEPTLEAVLLEILEKVMIIKAVTPACTRTAKS